MICIALQTKFIQLNNINPVYLINVVMFFGRKGKGRGGAGAGKSRLFLLVGLSVRERWVVESGLICFFSKRVLDLVLPIDERPAEVRCVRYWPGRKSLSLLHVLNVHRINTIC
jgi:hypothetical protein